MKRVLLLLLLALAAAFAQQAPEEAADDAVQSWLSRPDMDFMALASSARPPEEVCRDLLAYVQEPPPPTGTRVNLADRLEQPSDDPNRRVFTYPAAIGDTRFEVLEVRLVQANGNWETEAIGFRAPAAPGLPSVFQQAGIGLVFVAFTVLLIYGSFTQTFFRRWLELGLSVLRRHRRLVIISLVLLYGAFAVGMLTGSALPPDCEAAFGAFISGSLGTIGIIDVAQQGDVAQLAAAITYWNFTWGTLVTTLVPAYLLALPAYLINLSRFYVLGIPFGFNLDPTVLLLQAPVIIIELLAYILVTIGGAIMVVTLFRKGFGGYREAVGSLLLMLPFALVLLVIGAWYEAFLVL